MAYLCKRAPVAKFKRTPFVVIKIQEVNTVFTKEITKKTNFSKQKIFTFIFALNFSANEI